MLCSHNFICKKWIEPNCFRLYISVTRFVAIYLANFLVDLLFCVWIKNTKLDSSIFVITKFSITMLNKKLHKSRPSKYTVILYLRCNKYNFGFWAKNMPILQFFQDIYVWNQKLCRKNFLCLLKNRFICFRENVYNKTKSNIFLSKTWLIQLKSLHLIYFTTWNLRLNNYYL